MTAKLGTGFRGTCCKIRQNLYQDSEYFSKLSRSEPMPVVSGNPPAGKDRPTGTGSGKTITIKIEKLADKIIVKEEGDIDEIGDKVVKKILKAMENV